MNILFFSRTSTYVPGRIGGAETSMALMAEKMADLGHQVIFLSCADEDECPSDEALAAFLPVKVVLYTAPKRVKTLFWNRKPGRRGRKKHFEHFVRGLIDEHDIDLFYSHYDRKALTSFLEIRKSRPFKLVMRMAGLKWFEESLESDQVKAEYEQIFREVDAINYNTPGLKTLCHNRAREIEFDLSPRHEFIADIGARAVPVHSAREKTASEQLDIIVATRFSAYQKRQDILVQGLALLPSHVQVRVTMIGSGSEREKIAAMIEQKGLSSCVEIIPFVEQEELWRRLGEADILCHPCEYEGLSKIIVESMMLGLPVVVSNVLPISDYVEHRKTGYLVENTPEAWSQTLQEIFERKDQLPRVGAQARDYSVQAFNPERNAGEYLRAFERVLALGA